MVEREARARAAATMRAGSPPVFCGYHIIGWNIDTRDFMPGIRPERIERTVLGAAAPGRIVLMHDGPAEHREATVVALEGILAVLRRERYRFVTVGELIRAGERPRLLMLAG
jgi:peptidoglycan/xylan/chitin deacetylase (PgdA/CDA1 family)